MEVQVDYVGFDAPNNYVVGFGFDIDNNYRNYLRKYEPKVSMIKTIK